MRHERLAAGAGQEEKLDRLVHHNVAGEIDHGSVGDEGRVQRRECVILEACMSGQRCLDDFRVHAALGQVDGNHTLRKPVRRREAALEAAIHEDQAVAILQSTGIRRQLCRRNRRGRELKGDLGQRRQVGESPILMARRRHAELAEARDGGVANAPQPRRIAPAQFFLELPELREVQTLFGRQYRHWVFNPSSRLVFLDFVRTTFLV